MRSIVLTAAWLVCCVYASIPTYWLLIHPFVEHWRARPRWAPLMLGTWWAVSIGLAAFSTSFFRSISFYWSPWAWIPAGVCFLLAVSIYRKVGRSYGGGVLVGRAEIQPGEHKQELVLTPMHRRVRHPIYLGHWLMLTGWTIGSGLFAAYVLWGYAVFTGYFMIRLEEGELEDRFGDQFRAYKQQVPAILPRLR